MSRRLAQWGEWKWLNHLIPQLQSTLPSSTLIPPGDDAAVLKLSAKDECLVVSTDAFVEGIHFDSNWFSWEDVGYKALAVNVSDLAAMGAVRPLGAVISTALPANTSVSAAQGFLKGILRGARQWKVPLLGGDTTGSKGGWMVSIAIWGSAKKEHLIQRTGARTGDVLMASGYLGLAKAGLEILQSKTKKQPWMKPLLAAFRAPQPRLTVGAYLGQKRLASGLMDCSDGLATSVQILSKASHVGFELQLHAEHLHPALVRWAKSRGRDPLAYVRDGGEEYELLFTTSVRQAKQIQTRFPAAQILGRAISGPPTSWERSGYDHFRV